MPSATDFLPSSMTMFMNLERTRSPNLGSGRISRFSGRRRRDIRTFLLSSAGSGTCPGLTSLFRHPGFDPGSIRTPDFAGVTLRGLTPTRSLRTLGAVFRARLTAILDALSVEHAAPHMVTHTGKVAHTAAADEDDAMFLAVVALAGNVAEDRKSTRLNSSH